MGCLTYEVEMGSKPQQTLLLEEKCITCHSGLLHHSSPPHLCEPAADDLFQSFHRSLTHNKFNLFVVIYNFFKISGYIFTHTVFYSFCSKFGSKVQQHSCLLTQKLNLFKSYFMRIRMTLCLLVLLICKSGENLLLTVIQALMH